MALSSLSSSSLPIGISLSTQNASFHGIIFKWGWSRQVVDGRLLSGRRRKGQAIRVLASANVSQEKRNAKNEVFMVDPLEAKRLAAKQMEEIKAKENFRRKRQIEAINGAWAMIGLTAGLVIEGQTGNSILAQFRLNLSYSARNPELFLTFERELKEEAQKLQSSGVYSSGQ